MGNKNISNRNNFRLIVSLSLTIFSLSCPLSALCVSQSAPSGATEITSSIELPKGEIYTRGLGLSPLDVHLVNQGRFAELANKLSSKVSSEKADRQAAWLAFAYLYLQKCDDLNKLVDSYKTSASGAASNTAVNLTLIQAFSYLCNQKLDLAQSKLQTIPASAMNDAFVNYAFATLSGKQGKPQVSIAYTKRAVELAPDFAWGYRTIAFLQERWLNQANEAKQNYSKALEIEPKLTEATTALIALYLANSDYDQAIDIAKQAIAHNPRNAANYRQLANIYIQQWRLKEAARELRKAVAIDSENSQIYRQLAFILHKTGDLQAAIAEQKKAVNCSTDKSADLVELAALQIADGNQSEAVASLKKAIDLNPENMTAVSQLTALSIQMGKFDDLISELNKSAAKLPKNALIKIRLGDALAAAKQTDKAIEAYKQAANLNPNNAEPHTKIAALLVARKDYEGAAKEYKRALNINSNSVASLIALGGCEAQLDDYLQAEAAFVTALALHQLTQPVDSTVSPTRVEIIKGLATLLFKEGRYADSANQFIAVSEIDKNTANVNLNKFMTAQAIALRDLSKDGSKNLDAAYCALSAEEKSVQKINYIDTLLRIGRYDEALVLLNEIVANGGAKNNVSTQPEPFVYLCLSRAYLGKGDTAKAEEAANQAIIICDKTNSPHSDAYCQLADVLFAKNDLAGAEKNANNAIGINAKAFRAYILLGNIALKRKENKLAIEAANKAIEINPYYVEAYLLLGKAQINQNDLKGALTTYNKAADLYPGLLSTHESLLAILTKIGTKEEVKREQAIIAGLKSRQ